MISGLPMHAWRHVCMVGDTVRGRGSTSRPGAPVVLHAVDVASQWSFHRLAAILEVL